MTLVVLLGAATSALVAAQAPTAEPTQAEIYLSATIDANGHLAIVRRTGQTIIVPKAADQTAFSTPVLSPAGTAVAAQAMFANCCTSYDIPLQLVVYAAGRLHRFTGSGLPIFQWGFADGGTRIAYGQETVHSACFTHYELRGIQSERLIEAVDVPQPCGLVPNPEPVKIPDWVAALIAKK